MLESSNSKISIILSFAIVFSVGCRSRTKMENSSNTLAESGEGLSKGELIRERDAFRKFASVSPKVADSALEVISGVEQGESHYSRFTMEGRDVATLKRLPEDHISSRKSSQTRQFFGIGKLPRYLVEVVGHQERLNSGILRLIFKTYEIHLDSAGTPTFLKEKDALRESITFNTNQVTTNQGIITVSHKAKSSIEKIMTHVSMAHQSSGKTSYGLTSKQVDPKVLDSLEEGARRQANKAFLAWLSEIILLGTVVGLVIYAGKTGGTAGGLAAFAAIGLAILAFIFLIVALGESKGLEAENRKAQEAKAEYIKMVTQE